MPLASLYRLVFGKVTTPVIPPVFFRVSDPRSTSVSVATVISVYIIPTAPSMNLVNEFEGNLDGYQWWGIALSTSRVFGAKNNILGVGTDITNLAGTFTSTGSEVVGSGIDQDSIAADSNNYVYVSHRDGFANTNYIHIFDCSGPHPADATLVSSPNMGISNIRMAIDNKDMAYLIIGNTIAKYQFVSPSFNHQEDLKTYSDLTPQAIAVKDPNAIYVMVKDASNNYFIHQLNSSGTIEQSWGIAGIYAPDCLEVDNNGLVYFMKESALEVYSPTGYLINTINYSAGTQNFALGINEINSTNYLVRSFYNGADRVSVDQIQIDLNLTISL